MGAIVIHEKTRPFNAHEAELSALQEAVRHAYSTKDNEAFKSEKWVFLEGLQCYDRWLSDFTNPYKKRSTGDSYCLGVYRSTHRAASEFMRELAPKYPKAATHFKLAAGCFASEADALDSCIPLFGWGPQKDLPLNVMPTSHFW